MRNNETVKQENYKTTKVEEKQLKGEEKRWIGDAKLKPLNSEITNGECESKCDWAMLVVH